MAFAIMRCKKLTGIGGVAASLKHCYRERETFNADAELTPDNEHFFARSTDEAMGQLRDKLPEKRRKDAVLAVEYLCTASPEWWKSATSEQQAEFFKASLAWLSKKYGETNILVASVHRDETSPHLSAFVVPLTPEGRLSAKEFIGDRKKMTQDQTSFAQGVQHLGLERGIEGSKAHHTTISAYYARLAMPLPKEPAIAVPEPSMGERFNPKKYGERVAETVMAQVRPALSVLAHKAHGADLAREDKALYQRLAKRKENELLQAQQEAKREADARVLRKEQELEQAKAQTLAQVELHIEEKHKAEFRGDELELQLQRANHEIKQAADKHTKYIVDLLNAPDEQVLRYLHAARAEILSKDRENDLER